MTGELLVIIQIRVNVLVNKMLSYFEIQCILFTFMVKKQLTHKSPIFRDPSICV